MAKIMECPKCGTKVDPKNIDQRHCWICRTRLTVKEEIPNEAKGEYVAYLEKKQASEGELSSSKPSGNWFAGLIKLLLIIGLGVLAYMYVPGWLAKNDIDTEKVMKIGEDIQKEAQDVYDKKISAPLEKKFGDRL